MQARYYDPVIGRFLSNDPMSFVDSKYDVRYFTRYAYVGNNPINATDPTGEAIETAWDIANVVIGAASTVDNLSKGNYGDAAIDAIGVVLDGAATVVPFVPGGASTAIKVSRTVKKGRCCFVAGTLVSTESGLKKIEDIKIGDLVWSQDEKTGKIALKSVTDFIDKHDRNIWEVRLSGLNGASEAFETKHEHPWWVPDFGWKETSELRAGMSVITQDGNSMVVDSVVQTDRIDAVYNLTVADFETYFVGKNRILVHNCSIIGGGKNARKANANRVAAAKKNLASAKKDLATLKLTRNKTPAIKKAIEKAQGRVNKAKSQLEKSENHAQNTTRR